MDIDKQLSQETENIDIVYTFYHLGTIYRCQGRHIEADEHYKEAIVVFKYFELSNVTGSIKN